MSDQHGAAPPGDRPWRRGATGVLLLLGLAVALALLRLCIERPLDGAPGLDWPDEVVRSLRLGAILAATVVGISLGVSGTLLQATLRNPLADPFILGVSAGAGLGVAIATAMAWKAPEQAWWMSGGGMIVPASVGAGAALLATQVLGTRRSGPDPLTLVLAGVVVSAMCGAATLFVQHLLPYSVRGDLSTWMMGRLPEAAEGRLLGAVGALAAAGLLCGAGLGRAMDAMSFGDDEARAIGLRLGALRLMLATVAGILAAGSVAIAGPLAFVGLMAPHLARLLLGDRHRLLVVGAALMGASLLMAADCLRQVVDVGAGRVPVGVFSALAGGPLFLVLLRTGRGRT